jgi:hypothetical protein
MTTAAQDSLNNGGKAHMSTEADKINTMYGTGKDFDALVTTLKMAIERGDIDKENVHRLAHGLGIKPETLAQMVGVPSKDAIKAEDQDDAPKNEVSPPDIQKNFKDFRDETSAATSVTEEMNESAQMSSAELNAQIKIIRQNGRRTGKTPQDINKEVMEYRRLARASGGKTSPVAAGKDFASQSIAASTDPRIQRILRQNAMKAKMASKNRR